MPHQQDLKGFRVALALTEGGEPPTEVRIFPAGTFDTEYGPFEFTRASADMVMEAARKWGNDFHADYEHQVMTGGEAPAAAWYQLEVRETNEGPELWAVDMRWTRKGAAYVQESEYRYISPLFWHDENRVVTEFVNFALTNTPATRNMDALIAASKRLSAPTGEPKEEPMSDTLKRLNTRLGLQADAGEDATLHALDQLRESDRTVQQLTSLVGEGKDVIGTITAWRDGAQQAEQLSKQLAEREAAEAQARVEALTKQGLDEGKLTPASKDALLEAMKGQDGQVDPQRLEAYLSAAPKIAPTGQAAATEPPKTSEGGTVTAATLLDKDAKTEYERIVEARGAQALAELKAENPDEFQRILTEHRAARAS